MARVWSMVGVVAVVLVALVGRAPAASAQPAAGELECGVTPVTNVVLTHDLTCTTGFELYAHPVRVDLGGHTLTGPRCDGGPCSVGTIGGALDVTNGAINGDLSNDQKVDHLTLNGNIRIGETFDVDVDAVPAWRLTHTTVNGHVEIENSRATVDHNHITDGITIDDALSSTGGEHVQDNEVVGGGISWVGALDGDISGQITDNIVVHSPGAGIAFGPSSPGPVTIARNTLFENVGDGIQITFPPTALAVVKRNFAINNGGHGINAPGVTDGGFNVAVGSATSPQCIGVKC